MRVVFVLGAILAVACALPPKVSPVFNYHEEIGIPSAIRIKANEDAIHQGNDDGVAIRASVPNLDDDENRIVGGAVAPISAHPYLAGLIISFSNIAGRSVCGASILSSTRLVTAAHCWWDGVNQGRMLEVVMGSQFVFWGGTRVVTSQVVMHHFWNPFNLNNDIAMIYLPSHVTFNVNIQPVSLPSGSDLWQDFTGSWAIAAGYGITSDSQQAVDMNTQVSQVWVQVISVAQCQAVFGNIFVQHSNICTNGAGGIGICRGDSGGPLVVTSGGRNVLVGISSFVARDGCQLGHPSAFARVTSFNSFILQHM